MNDSKFKCHGEWSNFTTNTSNENLASSPSVVYTDQIWSLLDTIFKRSLKKYNHRKWSKKHRKINFLLGLGHMSLCCTSWHITCVHQMSQLILCTSNTFHWWRYKVILKYPCPIKYIHLHQSIAVFNQFLRIFRPPKWQFIITNNDKQRRYNVQLLGSLSGPKKEFSWQQSEIVCCATIAYISQLFV